MTTDFDRRVVQRLLDRDESALREIVVAFGGSMMATALHVSRDRTIAEDTVQEVLVALWREPTSYDPSRSPLGRWLHMRCRSAAIDRIRSHVRRERREGAFCAGQPTHHNDSYFADDVRTGLLAAIGNLTTIEQRLLQLTFVDGLSYRAAALTLAIPEGTAKSRMRRTLAHLRDDPALQSVD